MPPTPEWDRVSAVDVSKALKEFDQLGAEQFFAQHGFAPTTTYELVHENRLHLVGGSTRSCCSR
jgi:hypothetical protein